MATALPLQDKIAQSSQSERTYNIIKAQYGNGYQDRAKDGTNPIKDKWTINYENLTLDEYTSTLATFDSTFGVEALTWTPIGESTSKSWIVTTLTRTASSGNVYTISATLEQVFDLG